MVLPHELPAPRPNTERRTVIPHWKDLRNDAEKEKGVPLNLPKDK